MSDKQATVRDFIEKYLAPQWLLALATVLYVSGFVCTYSFFDRYGVHETGEVFLKARYIQAGILFFVFPVGILVPFLLKILLKRAEVKAAEVKAAKDKKKGQNKPDTDEETKNEKPFHFRYSTMVALVNASLIFYFFIFTPRNFVLGRGEWMIPLAAFLCFIAPFATDSFVRIFIVPRYHGPFTIFLRWTLLGCVICGLDVAMFWGFIHQLRIIFWGQRLFPPNGAIYYFFFITMIPFIFWRTNYHCQRTTDKRSKANIKLIGVSFALMCWYLGILAFAMRVYPHIPSAKGGGNFLENSRVKLILKATSWPLTNAPTHAAFFTTNSFIIIEQTESSLFLANATDAHGPISWAGMLKLPNVIEVRQDALEQIIYTQFTDTNFYADPK